MNSQTSGGAINCCSYRCKESTIPKILDAIALGVNQINPSALAFKFITKLKQLNKEKTKFSDFIIKERTLANIPEEKPVSDNEIIKILEEDNKIDPGYFGLVTAILQSKFGIAKIDTSTIVEKYKNHPNICELWTAGVDTFDFGASSTSAFLKAVHSGKEATYAWWNEHRDPAQSLDKNEHDIVTHLTSSADLPYLLDQYLEEKTKILNHIKYSKDKVSTVRLKQLATYINIINNKGKTNLEKEIQSAITRLEEKNAFIQNFRMKLTSIIDNTSLMSELKEMLQNNKDAGPFNRAFHSLMSNAIDQFNQPLSSTTLSLPRLAAQQNKITELKNMLTTVKENVEQLAWWAKSFQTIQQIVVPDNFYFYDMDKNGKRQKPYATILNEQPLLHDAFEAMDKDKNQDCFDLLLKEKEINLLRRPHEQEYTQYLSIFHHIIEKKNPTAFKLLLSAAKENKINLDVLEFADGKTLAEHFSWKINFSTLNLSNEIEFPSAIESKDIETKDKNNIFNNKEKFRSYCLTPNDQGMLPIHEAVMMQDQTQGTLMLTELLKKMSEFSLMPLANLKANLGLFESALFMAVTNGDLDKVKLLRAYDVDVDNAGPADCPSALTAAAKYEQPDCIAAILDSKPSIIGNFSGYKTISRKIPDSGGKELLHFLTSKKTTTEKENQLIYKILSEFKTISIDGTMLSNQKGLYQITKLYDNAGKTPLHYIIENNNIKLLEYLKQKGAGTIQNTTWFMDTYFDLGALGPLSSCAKRLNPVQYTLNLDPPRFEIALFLYNNCYDPTLKAQMEQAIAKANNTIFKKNLNFISSLESHETSVFKNLNTALNKKDTTDTTRMALLDSALEIMKTKHQYLCDKKTSKGINLLYILIAALGGNIHSLNPTELKITALITEIINKDSNIKTHISGKAQYCPLSLAAKNKQWDIFNKLYPKKESRHTLQDVEGNTCLHYLALNATPTVFLNFLGKAADLHSAPTKLLCSFLTDFNVKNKDGLTPLQMLIKENKTEIIQALLDNLYTSYTTGWDLSCTYTKDNLLSTLIGPDAFNKFEETIELLKKEGTTEMQSLFTQLLTLEKSGKKYSLDTPDIKLKNN